jgi:type IV secretory pathway VirB2 component (pilin)
MNDQVYAKAGSYQPADNLQDLRGQLTRQVALIVVVASGLLLWLTLIQWPFPIVLFGLGLALMGLGVQTGRLSG